MRVVCSLIGILSIAMQTVAAQQMRCDTLRASVPFAQGFSTVTAESTRLALDRFADRLRTLCGDADGRVVSIEVEGWASPEGVHRRNGRLSEARARNVARYLAECTGFSDAHFAIEGRGIDWARLETAVAEDDRVPAREAVLHVLRETPVWIFTDGRVTDGRKRQLGMLRGGRPYEYMAERIFPDLRRVDICAVVRADREFSSLDGCTGDAPCGSLDMASSLVSVQKGCPGSLATDTTGTGRDESIGQQVRCSEPDDDVRPALSDGAAAEGFVAASEGVATAGTSSPTAGIVTHGAESAQLSSAETPSVLREPRWALKTNLLYDALLIPNIGIEYRFARRWSASVDYMHAWWSCDEKHRYWRCYGGEVLVRRYFGDRPFAGHHVGLYGMALTYDFEFGGKGRQSDGFGYGGGVEYGYSLPVGRRLNIDFSIGLGYFGGRYKEYVPMDGCYVWQSTRRQHWFGPTRAEVSLVWILGGDRRSTKGGAR